MDSAEAPATNQVMRGYMVLRNVIGVIAVGLPFAVYLGDWIIFSHHRYACLRPIGNALPDSLSGYYYSHMRDLFVGAMFGAGVFLVFYRGDDRWERWVTNTAGAFAAGIALFPTSQPHVSPGCSPVTRIIPQPAPHASDIAKVHTGCLIGLMTAIALMAFLFARERDPEHVRMMVAEDQEIERDSRLKSIHKKIYYGCVAALVAAGIFALVQERLFSAQLKADAPWLLYAEVVAFTAFGVAWFVKGRVINQLGKGLVRVMRRGSGKVTAGT